jgi:hypothetical protein
MMRDVQKRLARLERNRPPQQTQKEKDAEALSSFIDTAIGYHLGEPKSSEAAVEAFGRALGYTYKEFLDALKLEERQGSNPELSERYARVRSKLFAKFGFDLHEAKLRDDAVWYEFIEILKRMHASMSERYKDLAKNYLRFD